MPVTVGGIIIQPPSGVSTVVTISFGEQSHTAVMYTAKDGATPATLPATITTATTYHADRGGIYTVSCKVNGIEIASNTGAPVSVGIGRDSYFTIVPQVDISEIPAFSGAASGSGNVAADAIWDAADDLAVGSGDNTAARLAVPASRIIAKLAAGGLKAATADEILTLLGDSGAAGGEFATVATSQTTTSTTFADLTTPGPAVTFTVPANGKIKMTLSASLSNSSTGWVLMSAVLSGANSNAASDGYALTFTAGANNQMQASRVMVITGLTPGSTTFTCKYRVTANTGTFALRDILVEPAPF